MKYVLLLAFLCGPAWADQVARTASGNELRLMDLPCSHGGTLLRLKAEWRDKFKKATATMSGKMVFGCYIRIEEDGVFYILMEDAEGFALPFEAFKDAPSV